MYTDISEEYEQLMSAYSRQARAKIAVGDKEYDSLEFLLEHPTISHVNETMCGGFPAKEVSFSIRTKSAADSTKTLDVDLYNDEIEVYRGLVLSDGTIEYIPQGIFHAEAEDIETSDTGNSITYKGTDRATYFDIEYTDGELTYPCTILDFVQNVCSVAGVELETADIPMSDYELSTLINIDDGTTCREIISKYAEMTGTIAYITRDGYLTIKKPTDTGMTISVYDTLSVEESVDPINYLVLDYSDFDDPVSYPDIEPDNPSTLTIEDNPFIDLQMAEIIEEVYDEVEGLSLVPFSAEGVIDSYIFDLNDVVTIQRKDGTTFQTSIISYESSGRIKATTGADTQDSTDSCTLENSTAELAKNAKIYVDKVNSEITMTVNQIISGEQSVGSVSTGESGSTTVTINSDGISVGKSNSDFTSTLSNEGVVFESNGETVATYDKNGATVNSLTINNQAIIGNMLIRKNTATGRMGIFDTEWEE